MPRHLFRRLVSFLARSDFDAELVLIYIDHDNEDIT